MDIDVHCTICALPTLRPMRPLPSAAYCSLECQQTDWAHPSPSLRQILRAGSRQLCQSPFSNTLSCYFLPYGQEPPSLVWVNTKKDKYEVKPYFHPVLDQLLHIPGNEYIGRGLRQVQGNLLRGRPSWQDTLNIWF
ncbi:hypothetical protein FocnCong_v011041 [Fusarium oxysporum f. sp. conglutinans]|nr:hypothetical protein FocnCong_v011041 [Fusarium oxysporum f. sp. conglutinans]